MASKYYLLMLLSAAALTTFAQEPAMPAPPDYKRIEAGTLNLSSEYYYPHLFERYKNGDPTLDLEDYRHLYYGFVFDDRYKPLEQTPYADSISLTLQQNIDPRGISPELYATLERQLKGALEDEPFNMSYLNLMTYIAQMNGNREQAEKYSRNLNGVKSAITSSGSGVSKESPWHVLYRSDESDMLNSLGAHSTRRMYISFDVEYFHLPVKNNGHRGYYFNNGMIYSKGAKKETPSKPRFEFNPKYNPRSNKQLRNIDY